MIRIHQLTSCARLAGLELEKSVSALPSHLSKQIQKVMFDFRKGELWYKAPTKLELQTLAYLVRTTHPDWGIYLGSEYAWLEPRVDFRQPLREDRMIAPNYCRVRDPITREVESYVKKRIAISDMFIPGSHEQDTGTELDSTTSGRLLLLKKIMDNDYDPNLGITFVDAQHYPTELVSRPLRRLKHDLNVCGLHDLSREIAFKIRT